MCVRGTLERRRAREPCRSKCRGRETRTRRWSNKIEKRLTRSSRDIDFRTFQGSQTIGFSSHFGRRYFSLRKLRESLHQNLAGSPPTSRRPSTWTVRYDEDRRGAIDDEETTRGDAHAHQGELTEIKMTTYPPRSHDRGQSNAPAPTFDFPWNSR